MADATIDEVLAAIVSMQAMKASLLELQQAVTLLADRLSASDARLAALEAAVRRRTRS